jgi:hypothetical protein
MMSRKESVPDGMRLLINEGMENKGGQNGRPQANLRPKEDPKGQGGKAQDKE